jgi:hypothetical protein
LNLAGCGRLGEQQASYQKSAKYKKEINTEKPPVESIRGSVPQKDEQNCHAPQAVQCRPVPELEALVINAVRRQAITVSAERKHTGF